MWDDELELEIDDEAELEDDDDDDEAGLWDEPVEVDDDV
jgi:hypothetical protein